ncbi:ADP-ribosylglycohydrolase family protein [Paenibacillus kobensis]|uniref:ADP-ribosylglycohydrolase family protein n=1 Tax=Paenibacillus kobensis TaxID=59841 RepID=UPI000FDC4001|nr:ADP-ribosylglycohydrolase family protein [Paenibacillus kobensis]
MNRLNRIKGALYGVAVGDALGGTTEFMSAGAVKKTYGYLTEIIGGGVWELEPGEVTDDTMMTLCVAEGILEAPDDPMPAIGEKFLSWYRSDPKDIGNIIRKVLSTYKGNWMRAAFLADCDMGQSAGNGALMRCLPVALAYPELSDVERVSRLQSKMTHYDERCAETSILYNRIAHRIIEDDADLKQTIAQEISGTEYADLLNGLPDCDPTGFVVDTFRWVIHLLLTSASYEEVVQRAANEGGDSDTIAAISGGLAGLYYGFDAIAERYRKQIIISDRLNYVSERLEKLRRDRVSFKQQK